MKILFFGLEFSPLIGGGGTYLKNLTLSLSKLDTQVVLITSGKEDSIESINRNLIIKRFKIFQDLYNYEGNLINAIECLIDQIKNEKPDILQTQHSLETLIGKIANINFDLRHIITHHKTPSSKVGLPPMDGKWSLYDFVNSCSNQFYIISSLAFKENLLQSGVKPQNIELIYPGINDEVFKPLKNNLNFSTFKKELDINDGDVVILIPVMVRKRKGIDFVCKALSGLKIPNHNIKIIITGLREDMTEEIAKYSQILTPNMLIRHGYFQESQMPYLYNLADLTILPSKGEGLGLVLLEAMACGCPIIGTNVIGINEVIKDNFNGKLVEYGDANSLIRAAREILEKQDLKKMFIENGYRTLDSQFSLTNQAKKHLIIYSKLVGSFIKSSGGLLFRKKNNSYEVFLIKHTEYGYVLPKGKIKPGEAKIEAAIREVREEAGYNVIKPKFNLGKIQYSFNKNEKDYTKEVTFYAFQIDSNIIKNHSSLEIGEKILPGEWFSLEESFDKLVHPTEKQIVKELKIFLS